jgi:C4-dicarboxylate transporter DctM subunit
MSAQPLSDGPSTPTGPVGRAWAAVDGVISRVERAVVGVGFLLMTLLVFNEYLQREFRDQLGTDLFGLWSIEGQMNVALLLLIGVGFLGASLATQQRKHISVDALERALSPDAAGWLRRFVGLGSAALCLLLARGAWTAVHTYSRDTFEGVKVWGWTAPAINLATRLIPGEKFGPGTPYATVGDWENAQYDLGADPFKIPAFGFVEAGDRFPLWLPMAFITVMFGVMALRMLGQAFLESPPASDRPIRRKVDLSVAAVLLAALAVTVPGLMAGSGWAIVALGVLMVLLGAPLFVGVGAGTVAAWMLLRDGSPEGVINDMFESTKKVELLAIPFFVLAGNLMTEGSIARRLIDIARLLFGRIPGGLGAAGVLACAFFAAISGSSPVTVIAIGGIMFPLLTAERYPEDYNIGMLASAGSLGIIIPPSIPMLVYAIMVSSAPGVGHIDPTDLFKAGILPGLFIATVLIAYTLWRFRPAEGQPKLVSEIDPAVPWSTQLGRALWRGLPSLMLPVVILGGIYGLIDLRWLGLPIHFAFTVTEAAAVAVVYALFVELVINRELNVRKIPDVLSDSAVMMGSLFLVLVIAISLNRFFVFEQMPEQAAAWMLARVDSKLGFLIVVNLFLLVLGCLMDILSAIMIVAPLLAPIATNYGIHPIHFGIMFIVNLELGYLTPPMGINLFVASTVFDRPLLTVIRAVTPFLLLMLLCLAVVVMVPWLSLALLEAG